MSELLYCVEGSKGLKWISQEKRKPKVKNIECSKPHSECLIDDTRKKVSFQKEMCLKEDILKELRHGFNKASLTRTES